MARHVGLKCGVPVGVPALTVNRLCGSGFQAIANGAQVNHFFNSFYAGYFSYFWCRLLTFFRFFSSKSSFGNTVRLSNHLIPDQDRYSVCPDLGLNH